MKKILASITAIILAASLAWAYPAVYQSGKRYVDLLDGVLVKTVGPDIDSQHTLPDVASDTINLRDLTVLSGHTKATLPTVGTAGRLTRVTDDVAGVWTDSGTQWWSLLAEACNIHDAPFGAVGNGTNEERAEIQAALDVCKTVVAPPGTYLIESSLNLASNQTFVIMPGATLKAKNVAWVDTGILNIDGKSNVKVIGGGTLDGDKANNATGRIFGIVIDDSTNVEVSGITIKNMPGLNAAGTNGGDGILVNGTVGGAGSTKVKIRKNVIQDNVRQGISLILGSDIEISGNSITGTSGSNPGGGIDIEPNDAGDAVQDVRIFGNHFNDNNEHIIIAASGDATVNWNIAIGGNTFKAHRGSSSKGAITIRRSGVSVVGNAIDFNSGHAIFVSGPGITGLNAVVSSNVITGNGNTNERAAIHVVDVVGAEIIGNTFKGTRSRAIEINSDLSPATTSISDITVRGNKFFDCVTTDAGANVAVIELNTHATRTLSRISIVGNDIRDSRTAGNESDRGIVIATDLTNAERMTLEAWGNTIVGPEIPFVGPAGMIHIRQMLSASASLDFDLSVAASQDLTITVPGAALGDGVALGVPNGSVTADTLFWTWISATDTVTVRAMRIAGTPNPASGTFNVTVMKY